MKKRRGRPSNPKARRHQTTRAGRRGEFDEGTRELRRQRRRATGTPDLPADALGVLLGHGVITLAEYHAGRDVAELLEVARRALGLSNGGVHSVWLAILAGGRIGAGRSAASVEWALRILNRLNAKIGDPLAAALVFAVAEGRLPLTLGVPSGVARLREGLDRVARSWTGSSGVLTTPGATRLTYTQV
jgi:hypothetical protein